MTSRQTSDIGHLLLFSNSYLLRLNPCLMKQRLRNAFSLDLRALAILRIGVGLLLLVDLLHRLSLVKTFFTDSGVISRSAMFEWNYAFVSIHHISGRWEIQLVIFLVAIAAAIALILGYRTRLFTIVSWALVVSMHSRNLFILQGGDEYLRMVLFWGCFLPWNRVLSLDSLSQPPPENYRVLSLPTFALLFQITIIYVATSFYKTGTDWVPDGTAVYYGLHLDQFARPFAKVVREYPGFMKFASYFWWHICLALPFLYIFPIFNSLFRSVAIFIIILFHILTGSFFMLGMFPWIGSVGQLGLLPTSVCDKIFSFFNKLFENQKTLLRNFFENTARFLSGQKQPKLQPGLVENKTDRYFRKAILLLALLFVFVYNIEQVGVARGKWDYFIPAEIRGLGVMFRLDQSWAMFSPGVTREDGWYIMKATLNDGSEVDIFQDDGVIHTEKIEDLKSLYKRPRWRKFIENWRMQAALRDYLGEYLIRKWNAEHGEQQHVKTMEIIYMREATLPDYETPEIEPVLMWAWAEGEVLNRDQPVVVFE